MRYSKKSAVACCRIGAAAVERYGNIGALGAVRALNPDFVTIIRESAIKVIGPEVNKDLATDGAVVIALCLTADVIASEMAQC